MAKWILKAVVQKGISFLPFGQHVNFFFQKYVTRGVNLSDEYFEGRLEHCRRHYEAFRSHSSVKDFSHVEVGTGWYPVVPTGMFLYGAGSITTVDINRYSNEKYTHATLRKFREYHDNGKLKKFLPGILEERLNILLAEATQPSFDYYATLEKHHIVYLVMDARRLFLTDNSIDLVTSNNTFEHVYADVLVGILQEFKRLCKKGGVMSHAIDMSDHFQHMDSNITIYNFLKYSEAQWKWINNSIQPMNRMRIYDFREIYRQLSIPITAEINRETNMVEFNKVKLDKQFSGHSAAENAMSHTQLVSLMQ